MATNNSINNTVTNNNFTVPSGTITASGNIATTAGNILLPTTSSTVGQVQINSTRFMHAYGTRNAFLGDSSGNFTLTGTDNSSIGHNSQTALTSGSENSSIGSTSLQAVTSGGQNTACGNQSLESLTTASFNTAVGSQALTSLVSGNRNIAIGYLSGTSYTGSEAHNIVIGNTGTVSETNTIRIGVTGGGGGQQNKCFIAAINGASITPVGYVAIDTNGQLAAEATTTHAVQVGKSDGTFTSIAVGATGQGLMGNTAADPSWTGSPSFSGSVTAGTGLTATTGNIVSSSGNFQLPVTTTSVGAIYWGATPYIHQFGTHNFFSGGNGNFSTISGAGDNASCGWLALNSLTSGSSNSAIGSLSCGAINSGSQNCAVGRSALAAVTTTSQNVAMGAFALQGTTGANNTGIGDQAFESMAGVSNFNTGLGSAVGFNYATGTESSNILIGYAVGGVNGENNALRIGAGTGTGNGQINAAFISGINGITVTGAPVLVSASDQLGVAASSIRFKENIENMADHSSSIMDLRPVIFNFKSDESKSKQFGLIAEEVDEIMPELVIYDDTGKPFSVRYHEMQSLLLNELQKLKKQVVELQEKINGK